MKLVTYLKDGSESIGVMIDARNAVLPLSAVGCRFADMNELIERGSGALKAASKDIAEENYPVESLVPLSRVKLLAPIPCPKQDVLCLGINYAAHATEAERFHDGAFGHRKDTIYFSKRVNRAVAPDEPVPAHRDIVDSLDYESELGVILSKDAYRVDEKDAGEYIFGYTVINDISARNLQTEHKQWYFGKSLDGFTPMGPCILTADEVAFPPKLGIRSYVNGELRQNSTTDLLMTTIPQILSELSAGMTLKAGTIIATGTPSGVGMGFVPPRFLVPGDVVTCEVEGIGVLTNPISE